MAKLTKKQELFVHYYLNNNFNGTKAYKEAYGMMDDNKAAARSSFLIRLDTIKKAIDEGLIELKNKAIVTKEQLVDDLLSIKKGQLTGNPSPSQIMAAIKAIEIISKMMGYNAPIQSQTDITIKGEQPLFGPVIYTPLSNTQEQLPPHQAEELND